MSLLSVTVKKARFVGVQAQQFNTYVTLKLQNVKSTTVTVKGANPCWEQDFLFETNDINTGLLVEVWSKGMLWDRALGYHYIPLPGVSYANEDDCGQWVSLDSELEMRGGEVVGTKSPTGHNLLIACHFEQPFDERTKYTRWCNSRRGWKALLTSETAMKLRAARPMCGSDPENTEASDLQRKLEMLNNTMDQEARAEQARRQILYNIGHSGYSEDSDYTSDLNYPVGGQGANSSASQFRTAANQLATPQRSLETSRENSYERDDHQVPVTSGGRLAAGNYYVGRGHSPRYDEPYPNEGPPQRYSNQTQIQNNESSEPLSYNSRPRGYKEYRRRKHTWDYEDSQDGWYSEGYDYPATRIDDTRIYSDNEYYPTTTSSKRRATPRRPSLERQTTLYDEQTQYGADSYINESYNDTRIGKKMSAVYPECQTDIIHNDYYDNVSLYGYQDERYGQDEEDRQWDSGGKYYGYWGPSISQENKRNRKSLPQRPASSIGIHRPNYRPTVTRQRSYESEELDYSYSRKRKTLQNQGRCSSRLEGGTGKKLPPTPTKPSNIILGRKPISLPATPGRQLPRTRTPSEENYYKREYNEDYNYAYRSSQDNLPIDNTYLENIYSNNIITTSLANTTSNNIINVDVNGKLTSKTTTSSSYNNDLYMQDYESQRLDDDINNYYKDEDESKLTNQYKNELLLSSSNYINNYQDLDYYNQSETIINTSVSGGGVDGVGGGSGSVIGGGVGDDTFYHDNYHHDNTYPNVSSGIEQYDNYDKTITTTTATTTVTSIINQDNTYQDYQDSYTDSYKQDSYADSYKQDSFPESYTDSYKDDSYNEIYKDDDYNNIVPVNNENISTTSMITSTVITSSSLSSTIEGTIVTSSGIVKSSNLNNFIIDKSGIITSDYEQYDNNYVTYNKQPYQLNHDQTDAIIHHDNNQTNSYLINNKNQQEIYHYDDSNDYSDDYNDTSYQQDSYQMGSNDDKWINQVPELSETISKTTTATAVTTTAPTITTKEQNGYQDNQMDYYYHHQSYQDDNKSVATTTPTVTTSTVTTLTSASSGRRRKAGLQKGESIESHDELKDSYESPVITTTNNLLRNDYSTTVLPESTNQTANHIASTITTTAMVHSTVTVNGKRPLARTESYVEEIMDDEDQTFTDTLQRKDSQLSHQSQQSNHSGSQKPKLTRGDSYSSDHFDESYNGRRDSYQSVRQDSYGSITQDNFKSTDSYQKQRELIRGNSVYGQNFTTPQPISRAESYQRGYFKDQDSIDETEIVLSAAINGDYKMSDQTLERYERGEEALTRASRENSLVEPYKTTPPLSRSASPRGSITKQQSLDESVQMDTPPRSPPEPPPDEELLDLVGAPPVPTQLKERPEMTAKQRWHWAYNKITMQLNVSK